MTRYIIFWEWDTDYWPNETAERREMFARILKTAQAHLKTVPGDFGVFADGTGGYRIVEGTEEDVADMIWRYGKVIKWKVHPILDVDQSIKIFENMKD